MDKKPIYKKWWFWAIIVFILIGMIGSCSQTATKTSKPSDNQKENTATTNNDSQANNSEKNEEISYSEVKSYQKDGNTWKMIVFARKPTNEELIKIAKELHSKDKNSYYHLFDNNEKIQEYIDWDINYGKVKDKNGNIKQPTECNDINYCLDLVKQQEYAYKFPESWANEHELGMINEMMKNWQLSTPSGEKISDL